MKSEINPKMEKLGILAANALGCGSRYDAFMTYCYPGIADDLVSVEDFESELESFKDDYPQLFSWF